jgi:transketolase
VAVEAAAEDWWRKYAGLDGRVAGLRAYGESAPAGELFRHFGLTAANIIRQVEDLLQGASHASAVDE